MRHDSYVRGALFSSDGKEILSWSADNTLRLWVIGVDQDITLALLALQVKVFTGTEMNRETKQLMVLKPGVRDSLGIVYDSEALAHYKVCNYPESNVWRRLNLEEAEKVRPLKK